MRSCRPTRRHADTPRSDDDDEDDYDVLPTQPPRQRRYAQRRADTPANVPFSAQAARAASTQRFRDMAFHTSSDELDSFKASTGASTTDSGAALEASDAEESALKKGFVKLFGNARIPPRRLRASSSTAPRAPRQDNDGEEEAERNEEEDEDRLRELGRLALDELWGEGTQSRFLAAERGDEHGDTEHPDPDAPLHAAVRRILNTIGAEPLAIDDIREKLERALSGPHDGDEEFGSKTDCVDFLIQAISTIMAHTGATYGIPMERLGMHVLDAKDSRNKNMANMFRRFLKNQHPGTQHGRAPRRTALTDIQTARSAASSTRSSTARPCSMLGRRRRRWRSSRRLSRARTPVGGSSSSTTSTGRTAASGTPSCRASASSMRPTSARYARYVERRSVTSPHTPLTTRAAQVRLCAARVRRGPVLRRSALRARQEPGPFPSLPDVEHGRLPAGEDALHAGGGGECVRCPYPVSRPRRRAAQPAHALRRNGDMNEFAAVRVMTVGRPLLPRPYAEEAGRTIASSGAVPPRRKKQLRISSPAQDEAVGEEDDIAGEPLKENDDTFGAVFDHGEAPRFEGIPNVPAPEPGFIILPTWYEPEKKWYMIKIKRRADFPPVYPRVPEDYQHEDKFDNEKKDRKAAVKAMRDACGTRRAAPRRPVPH